VNDAVRYTFANSSTNIGLPGVPDNLQHQAGYSNLTSNSGVLFDKQFRNYAQIDATWFRQRSGGEPVVGLAPLPRFGAAPLPGGQEDFDLCRGMTKGTREE